MIHEMDNTAVYTFSQDGVPWKIIHKYICTFLRTIKTHSHSCSKLFNIFIIIVFNRSVYYWQKMFILPSDWTQHWLLYFINEPKKFAN